MSPKRSAPVAGRSGAGEKSSILASPLDTSSTRSALQPQLDDPSDSFVVTDGRTILGAIRPHGSKAFEVFAGADFHYLATVQSRSEALRLLGEARR